MSGESVIVEQNVVCIVRDGVILRADIYRPNDADAHPVLLRRTAYGKGSWSELAGQLAARGYLVVVQDIRGRHASDGEWIWAFAAASQQVEAEDGYDSVEWAAKLPHANGSVGTWGHSYDAWTSWRLAAEQPPSLRGILTAGITTRLLEVTRGILDIGRRLEWCYQEAAETRRRAGDAYGPTDDQAAHELWHDLERGKWLWFLPLQDIPEHVFASISTQLMRYYGEIDEEFWSFDQIHKRVAVPTCVITGWWDRFVSGVDSFSGMRDNGPLDVRDDHRLVVGPWSHDPAEFAALDPIIAGPSASGLAFVDLIDDFYRPILFAQIGPLGLNAGASYFTIGADRWQHEPDWPPPDGKAHRLFLHSGGSANTIAGDGWLGLNLPLDEPADQYAYDPRDPVMSLMGQDSQLRPRDQRPNDGRPDKLVYQSDPLSDPLELCGPVRVSLWATTDAPDTDWVARLIRVDADGVGVNLADGIIRARYRSGYQAPELVDDENPLEYNIILTPVSVLFRPGERIRLDIASSDFPNFDRNHNTSLDYFQSSELRVARQSILHDRDHASYLEVTVRGSS